MKNKNQSKGFLSKYQLFRFSIQNEIAVDRELLKRLGKSPLSFTPVRALKLLPMLDRFKIGGMAYRFFSLLFALFIPVVILFQFILSIFSLRKNKLKDISREVLLVANGRASSIFSQEFPGRDVTLININQKNSNTHISKENILGFIDLVKVLADSLIGCAFFIIKNRDVASIPQLYVTFNWFLTYRAMRKIHQHVNLVHFSNHYDRWAVLFDGVFYNKKVCLLQHGVLPDRLELPYKLKNLTVIYTIDNESELKFRKLYSLSENVEFRRRLIALTLSAVSYTHLTLPTIYSV